MEAGVDVGSTIMVALTLASALTAVLFAVQFARAIGGELGAAFRWVVIGTIIFMITRADDLVKMTGGFARMGIDYARQMWLPHSLLVAIAWVAIAYGFSRMWKAFR
jgi:hypothetical protein